ncbi:MAG: hypothetical protein LWW93_01800 [Hyphomicrobiales bacterium]|nr:hypothetical protein [Hyphomicrobiales bacterium]
MTRHDRRRAAPPRPSALWRDEAERARLLPRLTPLTPDELTDRSPSGRRHVLDRLTRALAAERRRGRAGHWSYSLARHVGLVEALAAERAAARPARALSPTADADASRRPSPDKKKRRGS